MNELDQRRIAEAVRAACLSAAQKAYDDAGISGLCEEGRWECALDAMRSLDIKKILVASQENNQM